MDYNVRLRCANEKCRKFTHDDEDATDFRLWWHPATYYIRHPEEDAYLQIYKMEAFSCPECGEKGVEIR